MSTRAGRVRELARSSRSKFTLVWHQFSTVQFPRHQFVWKVLSTQFGSPGPSASVQSVQFSSVHSVQSTNFSGPDSDWPGWLGSAQARFSPSSLQLLERGRGVVLNPLQRKSQPAGPEFVAWVEGWCALLAVLACQSGEWCGVGLTQIQLKIS